MAALEPRLEPVLAEQISIVRSFWLIVHADLKDVARIRATMDFLVREVKAARALFMPPHPATQSVRNPAAILLPSFGEC